MKKDFIKEIFKSKNFKFYLISSKGIRNTPYTKPIIESVGDAKRYVLDIEFEFSDYEFEGRPINYIPKAIRINYHGYNMNSSSESVEEYINLLESAIDFASRVVDYYKDYGINVECLNFTKKYISSFMTSPLI